MLMFCSTEIVPLPPTSSQVLENYYQERLQSKPLKKSDLLNLDKIAACLDGYQMQTLIDSIEQVRIDRRKQARARRKAAAKAAILASTEPVKPMTLAQLNELVRSWSWHSYEPADWERTHDPIEPEYQN